MNIFSSWCMDYVPLSHRYPHDPPLWSVRLSIWLEVRRRRLSELESSLPNQVRVIHSRAVKDQCTPINVLSIIICQIMLHENWICGMYFRSLKTLSYHCGMISVFVKFSESFVKLPSNFALWRDRMGQRGSVWSAILRVLQGRPG